MIELVMKMQDQTTKKALVKVAKLYYYGNLSQEEIARMMGISRTKVSRMLAQARAEDIVVFKVADYPNLAEEMADKLQSFYGLEHVGVVSSRTNIEQTKLDAGSMAAAYLDKLLRDGINIGVSWGTTVDALVRQWAPTKKVRDARVIQLCGGLHAQPYYQASVSIASTLDSRLDSNFSALHTPLIVSNGNVRDVLMSEPEIYNHFQLFDKLDVAIVGLGSFRAEDSVAYKAGYITLEQAQELSDSGFATDLCGNRIFTDGSLRHNFLSDRVISINPEKLKEVPNVVAVAVGEDKAASIAAASRGGYIDALFIDEVAALRVTAIEGL